MYKFIKKNQKKMMAIFGVALMIVFILPSTVTQMGGQNPVVAKMGDSKLHYREFVEAERDWQLLMRLATVSTEGGRPQIVPLPYLLGQLAVQQISRHPEMYLLLQREAAQMGVFTSPEQLDAILSGRVMAADGQTNVNTPAVRATVGRFLPVLDAYRRATGTVKVTDPMVRQALGRQYQSVRVKLVSFDAATSTQPTTQPSSEAIQEQFNRFANVSAGHPDERNPFGFGYRYPNQVKLQYVSVPFAQVREVVEKSKTPYDWQVEQFTYYMKHPTEFATTQPTTQADGQATTQPGTQPAVKPFEAVAAEIHEKLLHERATALSKTIQDRVVSALSGDYAAWARSPDATTRPASSLGAPYEGFAYLQALRDAIEKETGVRVVIDQVGEFKSADELSALPRIGGATYKTVPFAAYALEQAAPFVSQEQPQSEVLKLQQPSGILQDPMLNAYVFRLTDALAAHAPQSPEQVMGQIESDLRRQAAFERARQSAQLLLQAASESGGDLAGAARAADRPLLSVGPIYSGAELPEYPLSGAARADFGAQILELLSAAAQSDHPHPLALIALPTAGKVAVVQLDEVQPVWNAQTALPIRMQIDQQWRHELQQVVQSQWFDWDSVTRRTNYQATDLSQRPAPQAPPPPMF